MSRQDVTVFLRAIAIAAVVFGHFGLQPLSGGALYLLALAGYNFVKFTVPKLNTSSSNKHLAEPLLRYGWKLYLPTALYIAGIFVLTHQFSWTPLLMITEIVEPESGGISYWFIEVLLQVYLFFGLILIVSQRIRKLMLDRSFAFFTTAAVGFFIVRLATMTFILEQHPNQLAGIRLPHLLAFTYFVGAMIAVAKTRRQKLLATATVTAICAESLLTSFGDDFTVLFFGLLLTLWLPEIKVPRVSVPIINSLAFSSLFIYLSHFQVSPVFEGNSLGVPVLAQVIIAFVLGIGLTKAWKSRQAAYEYLLPANAEPLKRWA